MGRGSGVEWAVQSMCPGPAWAPLLRDLKEVLGHARQWLCLSSGGIPLLGFSLSHAWCIYLIFRS